MLRTPRLDVKSDNRLGDGLGLGGLLFVVLVEALLADTGSLGILLLVVASEQVDIVVVLLGSGGLGGVQGSLGLVRAVLGVSLGGVAGQVGEVILERGDVLVPPSSVGVLGGVGSRAQGLVGDDVGLAGRVAVAV